MNAVIRRFGKISAAYVSLIWKNVVHIIYCGTSPPLNSMVKYTKKDNAFLYLNVFRAIGYAIEVVSNTLNPVPTTVVPIVTRYDLTIVAACFTM